MDFKKIYKRGLGFSFLLLIFIIGVLFIPNLNKKQEFDGNSIFTSALEDNYEPNNSPTSAYDITLNEGNWLRFLNGTGTQWDDDWFMININPGKEHLSVALTFNHSEGDIDIELYNISGIIPLIGSYGVIDNESIDVVVPSPGLYLLRVYLDNMGNIYDLWWNTAMPSMGDDAYEENDFDGQAFDLRSFSAKWLTEVIGPGFQWDEDWYLVYLDPGEERIHVELNFWHMDGDINLEVYYYDGGSFTYLAGSYDTSDKEIIDSYAPWSGLYYIRVYGLNAGNEYDMFWEDLPPSTTDDDWMEENDFFWSSWGVDPNYYPGLKLVKDDEDWFHTYLNTGDIIDVSIYFDHMEGNLQLELWNPSEAHRIGSYSDDNGESLSYMADVSGDWRIRVYHEDKNSEVWYDLDIKLKDDFYEFNDEPHMLHKGHPSDLMEYEQTWLSDLYGVAVQGNNDWYIIDVTPGFQQLIIELKFNHSLGNIGLDIYEEGGSWITGNNSDTDDEYIDFWLPHPGMYAIMVYGNNWGNEYDMWWDDLKTDLRSDDNYELNNDPSSSYDISFAQNKSLWEVNGLALQFDEDWYEIYIDGSNLELIVWLAYDSAEGLMGFEVYDEDLNKITGNFTLTDNDYIVHDVSNGTHYIRVFGDNSGNVYNLWWATREPEEIGMIPGYDLIILIASIIGVTIAGIKIKRSKLKHK